ncbi:MAG: fibronectin type III domain-containing protein [Planctomycetota bacterium]
MWETDLVGESWVDYGSDTFYGNTVGSAEVVLIHEVVITGLATDSEYHYRVRTGADASMDAVNPSDMGGYVRTFSDVAWDENDPAFNDPLVLDGPAVGVFDAVDAGTWVETDITQAFSTGMAGGGMISLALCPTSDNGADYFSKEGAHPPELKHVYSGKRKKMTPDEPDVGR